MNFDYKDDIISSRSMGLGASDANMFLKIDKLGYVPDTCDERLAVVKGLCERRDVFKTEAMQWGDEIEQMIFDMLHEQDARWESNPLVESVKYSRPNCKLFCHIDFRLVDEEHKTVTFVECKATSKTIDDARKTYTAQLFVESLLGKEYVASLGRGWRFQLKLCHYNTDGYDGTLNTDKIEMNKLRFGLIPFDLSKCMDLVDEKIANMTEFYRDEVEGKYLPEAVKDKFDAIGNAMVEIKEREMQVNEFKDRLYRFMCEKNIKTIKTDMFTISRTDSFERVSFDAKKFQEERPKMYERFLKKTTVKGSAKITLKTNKDITD